MASDTSLVFNIIAKDQASKHFSKFKAVAVAALATIGAAAIKLGLDAGQAASDLSETQSKVGFIFGDSAKAVEAFADTAATSYGQTKQQALDAAATFATFGKSAGLTGQDLVGFSTKFTGLASDLASFNNTSPQEAIDAIGAALRGETEPLRKYGVLLDDATMRQEAMALGLTKTTTQALTPQQKVLAAQALIYKQTTTAQGDFQRTSGGLANQQRILTAQIENTKTELGAALLPIMLKVVNAARELVTWFNKNRDTVITVVAVIGTLVAIVWAVNAAVKAYTAVQVVLNVVMSANPIGLIIIAIGALIAIIVLVATKTKFFQTVWGAVWGFLKGVGAWFAGPFANFFVNLYHKVVDGVVNMWNKYQSIWGKVISFLRAMPGKIASAAKNMWNGLVDSFKGAVNVIIRGWNALDFGIHVHLPAFLGGAGFDIDDVIPDIPYLAQGGIVRARPGGTLVLAGEGGQDEAVVPLPRGGRGVGGGVAHVVFRLDGGDPELRRWLRRVIQSDGGTTVTFADGGLA